MPTTTKSDLRQSQTTRIASPRAAGGPWDWIALALVIILAGFIRVRLLSIPLERDEGEFAYMGQLMLQGIPPYKLAYNMKFPGTYMVYALIMGLFGQSIQAIHIGLLIANSISITLVFILGRRMLGRLGAFIAAASFTLLSVHPSVEGTSAHATQFALPFVLGGLLVMLKAVDAGRPGRLFLCGILMGAATLVKQHAAVYVIFCILYCIYSMPARGKRWTGALYTALGAAAPVMAVFAWLLAAGVFKEFWFWTIGYAGEYAAELTLSEGFENLKIADAMIIRPVVWLWLLSGVGMIMLWLSRAVRARWAFLVGLLLFSIFAVCPGWYFRNHYFVLMLPSLGLFIGVAVTVAQEKLAKAPRLITCIPFIVFACAWLGVLLPSVDFFFRMTPVQASRAMYHANPFPEALKVADYIKSHSSDGDEIAVLGSEPEICFYANRRSATGFIYMYGLTEKQKYAQEMRHRLIHEIEARKPRYLVFVSLGSSWLDSPSNGYVEILDWAGRYTESRYRVTGMMDLLGEEYWSESWGREAESFIPSSSEFICVYERIPRPGDGS